MKGDKEHEKAPHIRPLAAGAETPDGEKVPADYQRAYHKVRCQVLLDRHKPREEVQMQIVFGIITAVVLLTGLAVIVASFVNRQGSGSRKSRCKP